MDQHRQRHAGAAHQHREERVLGEEADGRAAHGAGGEELDGHVDGAEEAGDLGGEGARDPNVGDIIGEWEKFLKLQGKVPKSLRHKFLQLGYGRSRLDSPTTGGMTYFLSGMSQQVCISMPRVCNKHGEMMVTFLGIKTFGPLKTCGIHRATNDDLLEGYEGI